MFFYCFWMYRPAALNYSSDATVDNGSCCYISGCTNPLYNEYNPSACIDDGSCLILPGCTDDGGVDGIPACNFNPDANLDNGTCEYNSCADDCGVPFGDNSTCNPIGCGDPQADNYDPNAAIVVIDPEYCEYVGCTDQNSFNYNPVANINDGSCCYLDGCTDPVASNYSVLLVLTMVLVNIYMVVLIQIMLNIIPMQHLMMDLASHLLFMVVQILVQEIMMI